MNFKIPAAFSIISLIVSWVFAQASQLSNSIIQDGFDELFSVGILIVAVIVVWKSLVKKDESETQILKDQIKLQKETIDQLKEHIETLKEK